MRNILVTLFLGAIAVVAVAAWQALESNPDDILGETLANLEAYGDYLRGLMD